ncbi:uncharacterized protein HMPREF1541_01069 [Cyphellophora europaea CBS 101466]|uniref:Uncharacterized protein n=1 Tax=Cyphellophora europaea (strain CBS 101466) TaxID=1220924 RepID=W2SE48_CYPE1|nr:uncharacterized protein HMPREF1541_01069 [Cyphellophora europaea CBS 101466]ETN46880.1 hypothetical protein HMPREF1541_01069 [Cyphellophora europaea CBS 101466]
MVCQPDYAALTPDRHTQAQSDSGGNAKPLKKKRKKQPASKYKPPASLFKALQSKASLDTVPDNDNDNDGNTASPNTIVDRARSTPSEVFVFDNKKAYGKARALFSVGYSSAGAEKPEDANVKATLRWNELVSLLTSAPISCEFLPMKGVAVKVFRPARNGLEARRATLHKLHGRNPRCEREVIENYATTFKLAFGWQKDSFVLGKSVEGADTANPEAKSSDEDRLGDPLPIDVDSI